MSLLNNEEYVNDLNGSGSSRQVGARWGVHHSTVLRHRRALEIDPDTAQSNREVLSESFEHRPDGSSDYTVPSDRPWGKKDVEDFLRSHGQDPDTVTYTWGVTSNPHGGYWNKLNNVRQKSSSLVSQLDIKELQEIVRGWKPEQVEPLTGEPEAFVVGLADWQLGKAYPGNGTEQTVERLKASLENAVAQVKRLRAEGRNLRTLYLANLGDHIENVAGSYDSQQYEVDLNLRDQIELAIEMNMLWVKTLAPMFERVVYTANPCNHAQLTRGKGRSNVTDDADNATGLIAEFVKQLCGLHPGLKHVTVVVPRGEMIEVVDIEGISIATSHGHKISGNEESWLAKQSQRLVHEERVIVDLWFVAHRHSLSVDDFGPYTRIQATTCDPGSKWFTDSTGKYSRPGTTTFVVGEHLPGVWDDLKVL